MHILHNKSRLKILALLTLLSFGNTVTRVMATEGRPRLGADSAARGESGSAQQPAGATPVVQLETLVAELLRQNPELQAGRKRYEAALTRPPQESALPDPRITTGWSSNGNPLPGTGLGVEPTSNIGLQIAQELPYPGKRGLRGAMARKEAEGEAQMYRSRELSLVAQLKARFHELRFAYEATGIVERSQKLLGQLAKVAEVRYSVGKAMQQDLLKSQVELSVLENRHILLEQRKQSLAAEINELLNRPPESPLGRPEPLEQTPPLEPLETWLARAVQTSPLLRSQQALIDKRQLGVELARKDYYPDFEVMGGYYNMGRMPDMWEFRVQLNVPVYFWRKQRYGLEESALRLVEAQRTYRSSQQTLTSQIRQRYLAAEASQKLMQLYSERVVPQSRFTLESSLASYETGGVDFLTILTNFNAILDYDMSYYEQRAEYLKALSALEELVATAPVSSAQNEVRP